MFESSGSHLRVLAAHKGYLWDQAFLSKYKVAECTKFVFGIKGIFQIAGSEIMTK